MKALCAAWKASSTNNQIADDGSLTWRGILVGEMLMDSNCVALLNHPPKSIRDSDLIQEFANLMVTLQQIDTACARWPKVVVDPDAHTVSLMADNREYVTINIWNDLLYKLSTNDSIEVTYDLGKFIKFSDFITAKLQSIQVANEIKFIKSLKKPLTNKNK